jgi:Spy/CpxP family protein refolding chaperone
MTIGTMLMLVITLASTSQLSAQGKRGGNDNFRGKHKQHGMMLDLTEDQKEKMKAIRISGVEQSKTFKDELREIGAKHRTLVTANTPNMKAIEKSLEKMSGLKLELQKIQADKHQEVRALLTKEQLLKFDQKVMSGMAKRGQTHRGPHSRKGKMN